MATETKQTAAFTIQGRLSGLNEYVLACRSNKYSGAKLKKNNEGLVKGAIYYQLPDIIFKGKVHITYRWHEKNMRRDLDNIAFAKKFIQDALVECGVLAGDGWKSITSFADEFFVDKENPRVEVIISEV